MTSALPEVLEKLENCPFCGGEAIDRPVSPHFWTVSCTQCQTEGPPFASQTEAITAWNTRPALLASQQYAEANPLGGPASMLEAAARRIRAGEDFHEVLADYDLHSGDALLRDAGDGWMPIESAPQDGTWIDVWGIPLNGAPAGRFTDVQWFAGCFRFPSYSSAPGEYGQAVPADITHWRPLPQPPAMHAPGGAGGGLE